MTPPLATRLVVDLRPLFEGWPDPVLANVGLDGAIYATAKRSSESFRDGGFAKSRIRPTDYLVVRCVDGHVDTVVVRDESIAATRSSRSSGSSAASTGSGAPRSAARGLSRSATTTRCCSATTSTGAARMYSSSSAAA